MNTRTTLLAPETAQANAGGFDPSLIGREFEHFKGNRYQLLAYANDSETCETMVVYRLLYGNGGVWVRPAKMFFEVIERDGRKVPWFHPV